MNFFTYRWLCTKHHYQHFFLSYNYHQLCSCSCCSETLYPYYTHSFLKKKRVTNFVPKFVHSLSVRASVHHVSCNYVYLHLNHLMEQFLTLFLNRSHAVEVLGNISCYLDPCVKVKGQITYFLVNASPT